MVAVVALVAVGLAAGGCRGFLFLQDPAGIVPHSEGGRASSCTCPEHLLGRKISMATLPVPPSLFHRGQGALPLPAPTQLGCPQGGDRPLVPWVMGSGTAWLCCSVAPCHGSLLVPPCGLQASG